MAAHDQLSTQFTVIVQLYWGTLMADHLLQKEILLTASLHKELVPKYYASDDN